MNDLKVIIAGGSGFLGRILVQHFVTKGYQVVVLSRGASKADGPVKYVHWDGHQLASWQQEFEGSYALINLSGKSVDCRYHKKNKDEIYFSRLASTKILGKAVQKCHQPPQVWINASSATIYRHAEDRPMDEKHGELGEGFSVDVCQKWEATFKESICPHTRKIILRLAIVLDKSGGALKPLLRLVNIGLGGKQGVGKQYFSWLHRDDFTGIIDFILANRNLSGVLNATAPNPISNQKLMSKLRTIEGRSWGLPLPAWALEIGARLIHTETELILKSRRVIPNGLIDEGYHFRYPKIGEALEDLLATY